MLNSEQLAFQTVARDFARKELLPHAREWEQAGWLPEELTAKLGALGFLGMRVEEHYRGTPLDTLTYALIIEALAAGDAATSTLVSVHNSVCCAPIQEFGTAAQKDRFLPDMATGAALGAFALTEPGAGSDASALACRAVRRGDHYILNGVKQFITNGKRCALALVFARTAPGKKGVTAFIVPKELPGFHVAKLEEKLGLRASDTAQLIFEECAVPAELRLGEEGQGLAIAFANLTGGRIGIAAQAIGIAQAALDRALDYARERKTFGQRLIEHQALAFRLADLASELEAARALTWRAALAQDKNDPDRVRLAAMAKLRASETAERVVSEALQVFGGYGYIADTEIERLYRDVRITRIYEGTSDIQRLIIARELEKNG
ncbi:MAG TPA: acyl-CoA dehydrogenase family protein [Dongiaceae bacterium]|jgi:hypothetical protein|nr:acyl-CoA dehydrogenase family protein [Dongiaceae bacterium]